jgi:hypothetical protein
VHVLHRKSVCIAALYKLVLSVPERIEFFDVGVRIVTDKVMLGKIGAGNMRNFTRPTTR